MSGPEAEHRVLRIGHKGADLIVPGNTAGSFDAALEAGVDLIEFDVLSENPDGSGALLIAHDAPSARAAGVLSFEEGLEHLTQSKFDGLRFNIDMKGRGYEERVVDALRHRSLESRVLISTMEVESLPRVRAANPEIKLGLSVPKVKRNYAEHIATRPIAVGALMVLRRKVPRLVARAMRAGGIDACMSHQSLVTSYFVDQVRAAGGELYVWTVDSATEIARFTAMGVDGIASNDPRLFGPPAA
jgi:glycerophosphoryl diester phosphodiesterase